MFVCWWRGVGGECIRRNSLGQNKIFRYLHVQSHIQQTQKYHEVDALATALVTVPASCCSC